MSFVASRPKEDADHVDRFPQWEERSNLHGPHVGPFAVCPSKSYWDSQAVFGSEERRIEKENGECDFVLFFNFSFLFFRNKYEFFPPSLHPPFQALFSMSISDC